MESGLAKTVKNAVLRTDYHAPVGNRRGCRERRTSVELPPFLSRRNIEHVKAFWVATGVEIAQMALWFGADDLDGTVQEEKIYHMAGSTVPEAMTTREISRLIRAAGRVPVERDTFYNVVASV